MSSVRALFVRFVSVYALCLWVFPPLLCQFICLLQFCVSVTLFMSMISPYVHVMFVCLFIVTMIFLYCIYPLSLCAFSCRVTATFTDLFDAPVPAPFVCVCVCLFQCQLLYPCFFFCVWARAHTHTRRQPTHIHVVATQSHSTLSRPQVYSRAPKTSKNRWR